MAKPLTVLVIGDSPLDPTALSGPYRHALGTHAKLLRGHPGLDFLGIIAPAPELIAKARDEWQVKVAETSFDDVAELPHTDIAIILTAPEVRADIVQQLSGTRIIVTDTPLGLGVGDSETFAELCRTNGKHLMICAPWHMDPMVRLLSGGNCKRLIGQLAGGGGVYGSGLWHTGSIWVDIVRAIAGEIDVVQSIGSARFLDGPQLPDDQAAPFALTLADGTVIAAHPMKEGKAAELHLNLWGTTGRLDLSLGRQGSRASITRGDDKTVVRTAGPREAIAAFYDELAKISDGALPNAPWDGESGLVTERIVEAALDSADNGGDAFHFA